MRRMRMASGGGTLSRMIANTGGKPERRRAAAASNLVNLWLIPWSIRVLFGAKTRC